MTSDDRDPSTDFSEGEGSRSSVRDRPGPDQDGSSAREKKHLPLWQETILLLGVALVLAIVIKTFFMQAFYIPSESMEPGLVENDRILVQKVSYWGDKSPERGDIVVFKDPGGWLNGLAAAGPQNAVAKVMTKIGLYPSGGHLVKRVIGVEGDTIKCCDKQGRLLVNGEPLDGSEYLEPSGGESCDGPRVNGCTRNWTVGPIPKDRMFVMGDNRNNSADSSAHMCKGTDVETDCVGGDEFVPTDLVVGKVFVLLWPAGRFDVIQRPDAFEAIPDPR